MCGWRDDGQDDIDAHITREGCDDGTLWSARARYLERGACHERHQREVRSATSDELRRTRFALLEGVAVEPIPAADVSLFNTLHDGVVVSLAAHGDRVSMGVDASYLRARFAEPGDHFIIELLGCRALSYTPYDEATVTDLRQIVRLEPELVEAQREGEQLVIWGGMGVLRVAHEAHALRFDLGSSLSPEALRAASRAYWSAWRERFDR